MQVALLPYAAAAATTTTLLLLVTPCLAINATGGLLRQRLVDGQPGRGHSHVLLHVRPQRHQPSQQWRLVPAVVSGERQVCWRCWGWCFVLHGRLSNCFRAVRRRGRLSHQPSVPQCQVVRVVGESADAQGASEPTDEAADQQDSPQQASPLALMSSAEPPPAQSSSPQPLERTSFPCPPPSVWQTHLHI